MQALKVHIHGKVYQTGMLYYLMQQAFENNINGCVFYYIDYSIGLIAEGKKKNLEKFIISCYKGNVDSVIKYFKVYQHSVKGYSSFEVLDKMEGIKANSVI